MLAPLFNFPVSLILALGIIFCLGKAIRAGSWVDRSNYILHALMGLGMLGMAWHQLDLPLLPQLLFFGLASFWFLLQAVSSTESSAMYHDRAGRLSCLYHATMLAATAYMFALPNGAEPQGPSAGGGLNRGHAAHLGHAPAVIAHPASGDSMLWNQSIAQVLAVLFAVAVLGWLLPLDRIAARPRLTKDARNRRRWYLSLERGYEAGTALTMSLMFGSFGLPA